MINQVNNEFYSFHDESGNKRSKGNGSINNPTIVASLICPSDTYIWLSKQIFEWKLDIIRNSKFGKLIIKTGWRFSDIKNFDKHNLSLLKFVCGEFVKMIEQIRGSIFLKCSLTDEIHKSENRIEERIMFNIHPMRTSNLKSICDYNKENTIFIFNDQEHLIKEFKKKPINKYLDKLKIENFYWKKYDFIKNRVNDIHFITDFLCGIRKIKYDYEKNPKKNNKFKFENILKLLNSNIFS